MWELEQATTMARARRRKKAAEERKKKSRASKKWHCAKLAVNLRTRITSFEQEPELTPCTALLHETNVNEIRCFSPKAFEHNKPVLLHIDAEQDIYLRGTVTWCHQYGFDSKLITKDGSPQFRLGIRLSWDNPLEKEKCLELLSALKLKYFFASYHASA